MFKRFMMEVLIYFRNLFIWLIIAAIAFLIGMRIMIVKTAYEPETMENLETNGRSELVISPGQTLNILSWNIGSGISGKDADSYEDGGTATRAKSEEKVIQNIDAVTAYLKEVNAQIMLLQEVEFNSTRSWYYDEVAAISGAFEETNSAFAIDHKAHLVPREDPWIGKIKGGSLTLSQVNSSLAYRVAEPCTAEKKDSYYTARPCLLVTRYPIYGSEAELVVINIRLITYSDPTEVRAQMTRLHDLMAAEYEVGNYVICGGDFYQSMATEEVSFPTVADRWQPQPFASDIFDDEGWRKVTGGGGAASQRSMNLPYAEKNQDRIQLYLTDGFIATPNITINSCEIKDLGFENSDHNPILINITLQ